MEKSAVGCVVLLLVIGTVWTFHAKGTYSYVKNWPNNTIDENKIKIWQEIRKGTEKEVIVVTLEKYCRVRKYFSRSFIQTGFFFLLKTWMIYTLIQ